MKKHLKFYGFCVILVLPLCIHQLVFSPPVDRTACDPGVISVATFRPHPVKMRGRFLPDPSGAGVIVEIL